MNSDRTMALLMLGVESTDANNSFGHAFLAGMKFDIAMLKSCKTARDKEACLLNRKNSYILVHFTQMDSSVTTGEISAESSECTLKKNNPLREIHLLPKL
jgi:hypothetical protein